VGLDACIWGADERGPTHPCRARGSAAAAALETTSRLWLDGAVVSVVDLGFQTAFKVAHRMLRAYWFVRRPSTHGALVAVWNEGELLLVKNSYRSHFTLPGGYIRSDETPADAAARELREEVGIDVVAADVRTAYTGVHEFENRHDRVTISEIEVAQRPRLAVDNREVVWAGFLSPAQILAKPIVPHLADYLRGRAEPG
jgi:ADP-ribose pyrophosphatase YjhB (NUDIX family)